MRDANLMIDQPTVLDLFAGCGGLSIGLEEAGFDVRWANELDPDAAQTYGYFHRKTRIWQEDVNVFLNRIADGDAYTPTRGSVDLLAGGPPCQGFSGYNRYRSPIDARNSLVETYLAIVELLEPRFVLIENVPGMLQMESGSVPEMILQVLKDLGYRPRLGILQAGNFGLPQSRWRVFIMASRGGITDPSFPTPTHIFPRTTLFGATKFKACVVKPNCAGPEFDQLCPTATVGDAIRDLPPLANGGGRETVEYTGPAQSAYQSNLRRKSAVIFDHQTRRQSQVAMDRIVRIPRRPGAGWLDLPPELRPKNLARHGDDRYPNRFGRLWWDGIFNTIVTKPEPYWGRFIHPEQDRVISVREAARAQGLPDRMRFFGGITSRYRQVGNAVPAPLGRALGFAILRAMKGKSSEEVGRGAATQSART